MIEYKYPSPVIADRISTVLAENNITAVQGAKECKLERKTVLGYRNCIASPNVRFIRWVCKRCKVSADWLLDLTDERN